MSVICQWPVVVAAGMCCSHDPCDLEWERPCDAMGGCWDRATCGDCSQPVIKVPALIIGECECCGALNRVLHPTTAYGMDASPCSPCRGNPLSDDIDDLRDEVDRRYEAGQWAGMMELHAALTEAMGEAICRALAA